MRDDLAAVLALAVPIIIVGTLLWFLQRYLNRRRLPRTSGSQAARRRRVRTYYWLGVATCLGILGLIALLQHTLAGKPFVLWTWVVLGVTSALAIGGGAGLALVARRHRRGQT